jgi:hypothetical protein
MDLFAFSTAKFKSNLRCGWPSVIASYTYPTDLRVPRLSFIIHSFLTISPHCVFSKALSEVYRNVWSISACIDNFVVLVVYPSLNIESISSFYHFFASETADNLQSLDQERKVTTSIIPSKGVYKAYSKHCSEY